MLVKIDWKSPQEHVKFKTFSPAAQHPQGQRLLVDKVQGLQKKRSKKIIFVSARCKLAPCKITVEYLLACKVQALHMDDFHRVLGGGLFLPWNIFQFFLLPKITVFVKNCFWLTHFQTFPVINQQALFFTQISTGMV